MTYIVEQFDAKDKKILYQLDVNARQSYASIGRKTGLSKDSVNLRVNKLMERGIIRHFYTMIDATKLGYISCRLFIKFQYDTPETEKTMVDLFVNKPYTWWIGRIEGQRDLCLTIWARDTYEFYFIIKEVLSEYKWLIKDFIPGIYARFYQYRRAYLLGKETDDTKPVITCFRDIADCDETDIRLLKIISTDARLPLVDIAHKLEVASDTVRQRLKKLMKKQVIQGFRAALNLRKLGYYWYKIRLDLENVAKTGHILEYAHAHPNIVYAYQAIGGYDLELELEVESYEKFKEILNDIRGTFSADIRFFDHFLFSEEFKIAYMPMTI